MLNEDNICIKYLMNELDPSEAMLVEKAMMEDQDLLIEIECLRETLKKVDKLPAVQPPQELSEQIIQKAVKRHADAQKLSFQHYKLQQPKYYAAAAMMVAGVTIGAITFNVSPDVLNAFMAQETTTASTQSVNNSTSQASISQGNKSYLPREASISTTTSDVKPWVDRNNVLHYNDSKQEGFSFINDAIMKESMKKLKPINEPVHFYAQPKSVHLTGSQR